VGAWVSGLAAGDGLGVDERVRIHLRQPSLRACSVHLSYPNGLCGDGVCFSSEQLPHRSHSQALTLRLDLDPLSPDRRSAIAHRPLPRFFLVLLSPQPSQHRAPPDTHPPVPLDVPTTDRQRIYPRSCPYVCPPSLTIRSLCHTPPTAPACIRTLSIYFDLISPHAPYAPPPPPAPVLSCAPHSDPELDLVQLHCRLPCVRDQRPVLFLELLWLHFCVRFAYRVLHFTHVSYLEGHISHIDIGSIHCLASILRAPLGAHQTVSPPLT
jgi:hypothetical protein